MDSYHTVADVRKQFGPPNQIIVSKDTLQWLYNCDTTSNFAETKTKVKVNGVYHLTPGINTVPDTVKQFSNYQRYVKFTFDKEGKVLSWTSAGVKFAQRKGKTLATVGIVVLSIAAALIIIGSIVWADGFSTWGA
jgi:hypothetical protein